MDRTIPKEQLQKERRRRLIKVLIIVAGFIVVVGIVVALLRPTVKDSNLRYSDVTLGTIEVSVSASGRVRPSFEEIVTAPIDSRILQVLKRAGDSVAVGDPIVNLDLQSIQTTYNKMLDELQMKQYQLQQSKLKTASALSDAEMRLKVNALQLDKLKVEVQNERYLDSIGAGTTDKVRETELKYRVAGLEQEQATQKLHNDRELSDAELKVQELDLAIFKKELAETKRTLEDAAIRAPRAGILTFVSNEIGAVVGRGSQMAIISDPSHFKIEAEIADSYAEHLSPGSRALVKVGKDELYGIVSNITPQSKGGVIQFTVQIEQDDHSMLRSGLKTDVYVMTSIQEGVLRIAKGSYYTGPGKYQLFVKRGDQLIKQAVELGDSNHNLVEVVSGLQEGDRVVVSDMSGFKTRHKLTIGK